MIPYPYNMVDMGGIDLAEANGTVVEGLYSKIVEAVNSCGDVVLYNWKFAGIEIAPQHTSILLGDPIIINGAVQVTEQDLVTVPGINPDPSVLVGLTATENGEYDPSDYNADGFNHVNVVVPGKILASLSVTENGEYDPSDYDADGFSIVTVNVESPAVAKRTVRIWTQSIGGYDASVNVQLGTFNGEFVPVGSVINVVYNTVSQYTVYGIVEIQYSGGWRVKADTTVSCDGNTYQAQEIVKQWGYQTTVDMLVVEV